MKKIILLFFCAAAFFWGGCKKHRGAEDPIAQNRLFIRLFDAMRNDQPSEAAACAEKIRALDPKNEFLPELIERQQCNAILKKAQGELARGDFAAAAAILENAVLQHPFSRDLQEELARVNKLIQMKELLARLKRSDDPETTLSLIDEAEKLLPGIGKSAKFADKLRRKKLAASRALTAKKALEAEKTAEAKANAAKKAAKTAEKTAEKPAEKKPSPPVTPAGK